MYYFAALVLIVFFTTLAVSHFFAISPKSAKVLTFLTLASGAAGALLTAGTVAGFFIKLKVSGLSEENILWLRDTFVSFFAMVGIFALAVVVLALVSRLLQPKVRIMRVLLLLFSAVILIIWGLLFSFIAENGTLSVSGYIKLTSIGLSLAIQIPAFLDFGTLKETLTLKEKNKQKKR